MQNIKLKSNCKIKAKLQEFSRLNEKNSNHWFCELCFCILTANSKAKTAIKIQEEIGINGFLHMELDNIKTIIKKHGHRFYNKKAEYIILARQHNNIKKDLKNLNSMSAREFVVKNIKGIGYKEASHFLRNVGYHDLAIIDRHILRFLYQQKLIEKIPKSITKANYIKYENILKNFNIALDELDLIIWEKMTGNVLK